VLRTNNWTSGKVNGRLLPARHGGIRRRGVFFCHTDARATARFRPGEEREKSNSAVQSETGRVPGIRFDGVFFEKTPRLESEGNF